tara:strand:+ start:132 stop:626 length:495 start_codon:yes stop_codon:yes gene_type:complete
MPTTNENPTLVELKAIETDWNTAIDTEYAAVAAKYPEIEFDDIRPQVFSRAEEVDTLHPTTNEPLVWTLNTKTLNRVLQPREVINALKKKSLKVNALDGFIEHTLQIHMDDYGFVDHLTRSACSLADTPNGGDTIPGLTTQLAANKVKLITQDDGQKVIEISYD